MVTPGNLPQLLGTLDGGGKYTLPPGVSDTLRNLQKRPTDTPNQIAFSPYRLYESVPRLDKKAFRYAVRGGQMFLMEGVDSMGGLVTDTVLTGLGEFTAGNNAEPDFTEIIKIQTAKKRQRDRQLHENEQVAARSLSAVHRVGKNTADEKTRAALTAADKEIDDSTRFVRLGKPDYKQAQMEIISRHADGTEFEAVCSEHKERIDAKNQKWTSAKLRLPKNADNAAERSGTELPETIGKMDPKRRAPFDAFYSEKAPKIAPYLLSEVDITEASVAAPDQFVVVEKSEDSVKLDDVAKKNENEEEQQEKRSTPKVVFREVPLKMAAQTQVQVKQEDKQEA